MVGFFEKIKKHQKEISEIAYIFFVGTVSLTWFKEGFLVCGVDTVIPVHLSSFLTEYFYLWSWKIAFSLPDASKFPFLIPLGLVLSILDFFHLPFSAFIFQRLIVFFLFCLSGISAYFLFKTAFPDSSSWAKLLSGLFYMFSFYSLILWNSFSWLVFYYAFFPLILALFIKGINQEKRIPFFVGLALLWTFLLTPSYINPPIMIISWFVVILYFSFYSLLTHDWQRIRKAFFSTFWLGISWLFLNVFWLLPQILFYKSELVRRAYLPSGPDPWALLGYNSSSFTNIFRLLGPQFLADNPFYPWYHTYETPLFVFISFLVAFLVFSAFLFRPKNKSLLFFGFLTLVFIFLVAGTNSPFPQIIFFHSKLVLIFRSVWQRFMGIVTLGATILFGFAVDKIALLVGKLPPRNCWKYLFISLVFILSVGIYAFPFWTDQVFPEREGVLVSEKVRIPLSYYEVGKWLDSQSDNFNVLPLPFPKMGLMPLSWENGKEGYWGIYPLFFLSGRRFLITDFGDGGGSQFVNYLLNGVIKNVQPLSLLNIKYIIFHKDANWKFLEGHNWFVSRDKANTEGVLGSLSGLNRVKTVDKLAIYKISDEYFLPQVYPATTPILINGSISEMFLAVGSSNLTVKNKAFFLSRDQTNSSQWEFLENYRQTEADSNPIITFQRINPTRYEVRVENASKPFFLVFSESYHPEWKAYFESKLFRFNDIFAEYNNVTVKEAKHEIRFTLGDVSYLFKKSIDDEKHFLVNGYANAWYIDPKEIGRGNFTIALYFRPQSYFYIGLFISGLTLIGCIVFLFWSIGKLRNKKRKFLMGR